MLDFFEIATSLQEHVSGCTKKGYSSSEIQISSNMLLRQGFVVNSVIARVRKVLASLELMVHQQEDFVNVILL